MHTRLSCWVLSAALIAGTASANGRFPRAQRLIESAEKSDVLALYGTYGLIVTDDAGASWRHVCEAATGAYTGEDPLLELMPGSRLVLRTESALMKSAATWCDYDAILGSETEQIQDITRDTTRPDVILALTGSFDAASGFVTYFVASADAGATWSSKTKLPDASMRRGLSLDVAPSRPERVYVTGLDADGQGQLLVSDDGGAKFTARPILGTHSNAAPYLAFVSKRDPNVLFVRTDTYEEIDGIDTAGDSLLLSMDAGATWTTILKKRAKLLGVALAPDDRTLLAGYGDPVVAATDLDPADLGLHRASVDVVLAAPAEAASKFEHIYQASVTCLRWTASALYVCTSQTERGFELGKAPNADFAAGAAEPFTSLLRLPEVSPLPCRRGTDAFACYTDTVNGFPAVCNDLQASCDVSPPAGVPDAGVGGSDSGGSPASSGGSASGAPGATGGASAGGGGPSGGVSSGNGGSAGGGAPASGNGSEDSSCACRSAASGGARSPGGLLVLACAWLAARRRRGRPAGPTFLDAAAGKTS